MADKLTREEFVAYLNEQARESDGPPVAELEAMGFVIVPCDCDYENCRGWRIVAFPERDQESTDGLEA